jgi:DNA repair protein RecN (Recombination protein N)
MILELTVDNIAIIDRAQVGFGPGFTALTGETGAGKSLVIDAIGLALGERADSDLVRAGAVKGVVVMSVDLGDCPAAALRCSELGVDLEEGVLYIQREVLAEGRSTVRLNGRTTPVGVLKEIGALLVDLHGQHDHQALLHPERQIEFLDAWIGAECSALKEDVGAQYTVVEGVRRKLNTLRQSRRDREQRLDMLRFQVEEITTVDPLPGELEELDLHLGRLQNSERLSQAATAAVESLQDADGSAMESLSATLRSLEALAGLDPLLEEALEPLRSASVYLEDSCRGLRAYVGGLDRDPESLETTAARMEELRKLRRKYGDSEEAVLEFLAQAEEELALLEDSTASEESLAADLEREEGELMKRAGALTELRERKAVEFGASTLGHIRDLGMEKGEFDARLSRRAVDASGQDDLNLMFSANAGEPVMALNRVASGGELSRVMLAIKAASAGRAGVPTLIFDEVDTGLSGRAAATMARKLEELAQHRQVIVISHLPQIAGRATTHYRIEKVAEGARSVTRIVALDGEDRIDEIARMLAGEQIGASALANARELLAR